MVGIFQVRKLLTFVILPYAYSRIIELKVSIGKELIKGSVRVFRCRKKCYR